MEFYSLRFETKHGIKFIEKSMLKGLLEEHNCQWKVADELGVSQMTVSRAKVKLGIVHDGKVLANANPEKIRKAQVTGQRDQGWDINKKKPVPLSGKKSWNEGLAVMTDHTCIVCKLSFRKQGTREYLTCSKDCKNKSISEKYSDGRMKGAGNPMYGKGGGQRAAWERGDYKDRPMPTHSAGITTEFNGVSYRSTWEVDYAKTLIEKGYSFEYEPKRFYLENGRQYTPDFYICDLGIYVEVKGHWWKGSKFKVIEFLVTNNELLLIEDNMQWKLKTLTKEQLIQDCKNTMSYLTGKCKP